MRKLIICGLVAVMIAVLLVGTLSLAPVRTVAANPGTQWKGEYFNSWNASGIAGNLVMTRTDDQISFNWATGSPDGTVPADNFSVRWTKTVNFPNAGKWHFRVGADDGIRMWIDTTAIVDQWHGSASGFAVYEVDLDQLTAGNHDLKVEYYEATGNAGVQVSWNYVGAGGSGTTSTSTSGQVYTGSNWAAKFYNNTTVTDPVVASTTVNALDFDWGTNAPTSGVNADNFSAVFTTTFNFPTPGRWRFQVTVDDGAKMWIDVTQIVNEWHGSSSGVATYEVDVYALTAGNHDLRVEYYDATGGAVIKVKWWAVDATTGAATGATPVPTAKPGPTVYAATTGDFVNIRSGPGLGYPRVGQIFYPDNYVVVGGVADLSWLLIDMGNGSQGWVSNDWVYLFARPDEFNKDTTGGGQPDFVDYIPRVGIDVAPPAAVPPENVTPIILSGSTTDTINLRNGPSLYGANVIGSLPQNAIVEVQARNRNGAWYLVSYQGIRGWVSALYVRVVGDPYDLLVSAEVVPSPPAGSVFVPETESGKPAVTVRGRTLSTIKLRNNASLQSDEIGSIPQDTELVIEGRNRNGAWYLVTYNGQQGWVSSPYVTLTEGTPSDLPIR